MTRHTKVHVCIADPIVGLAVRKHLATNSKVRVTPWRAEHLPQELAAENLGADLRDGELLADIDVLLLEPEDLSRLEENEPGRIDELQGRIKVLLLLKSEDLPDSLEILRHCDGMIVRDVNMRNISQIIEFALHGYFVIPHKLMANFRLASPLAHAAIVDQIDSRANGPATRGGRNLSRDVSAHEYCATRTTMRRAIGNVLRLRKNGARAQLNTAAIETAAEEANMDFTEKGAASPARWRRALRDDDGRVTAGEYSLLFAALAIWGAILFDGGAATKFAKVFGWCGSIASTVECGTFASTPVGSADAGSTNAESATKEVKSDQREIAEDVSKLK